MTVKYFHDIIYENGEICFKFFMDEDILYLKCDETDWTCSFCGITKNKKEDYLYCKRCNFYLCMICLQNYEGIIYDVIEEVHIGFESQYFGQAVTNFLFCYSKICFANESSNSQDLYFSKYIFKNFF